MLKPEFSEPEDKVYTVQEGMTAFLECRVRHLGNGSVSWVREKDRRILAVDREVFISDPRLNIKQQNDLWSLNIQNVMAEVAKPRLQFIQDSIRLSESGGWCLFAVSQWWGS